MQRASCCCSGSRSGCCCWAICMLHAKCLSIEFVWLSVATSGGSTLTSFFAAYRFVLLLLLLSLYGFFFYQSFKQLPSILFATYFAFLCCCLPFYFSQRFVDCVGELGTWGSGRHLHVEVGEADILVRPVRAKDTSVHLYMHMHNLC